MLATMARINEICAVPWTNLDLHVGTWFIPADQSKGRREHMSYLSDFACSFLRDLHTMTGHTQWLLPGKGDKSVTTDVVRGPIISGNLSMEWQIRPAASDATAASPCWLTAAGLLMAAVALALLLCLRLAFRTLRLNVASIMQPMGKQARTN
jgi:hypothetical protein